MVSNWLHNIAPVTDSWYTVLSLIPFVDKRELRVNKHYVNIEQHECTSRYRDQHLTFQIFNSNLCISCCNL